MSRRNDEDGCRRQRVVAVERIVEGHIMLTVGMVILGLVTFAAMIGVVTLCDRV